MWKVIMSASIATAIQGLLFWLLLSNTPGNVTMLYLLVGCSLFAGNFTGFLAYKLLDGFRISFSRSNNP